MKILQLPHELIWMSYDNSDAEMVGDNLNLI